MFSTQAWADARRIWHYHQMHHELRSCSVAIGLGSHDLGVADTTADLYRRGFAPLIVFTGATSPTTRARMPRGEAVHYKERALELGVPESAVFVEPRARNTGQNIEFSRVVLKGSRVGSSPKGICREDCSSWWPPTAFESRSVRAVGPGNRVHRRACSSVSPAATSLKFFGGGPVSAVQQWVRASRQCSVRFSHEGCAFASIQLC